MRNHRLFILGLYSIYRCGMIRCEILGMEMSSMWHGYKTSDDLLKAIQDSRIYDLKLRDLSKDDMYWLDIASGHLKLPIKDARVRGADWQSICQRTGKDVRLPSRIVTEKLHWNHVFCVANLYCIHGNNTLSFGNYPVSVHSMFNGASFSSDSPFSLEIVDSVINVGSMFYCSYGLDEVRFTDCELIGLRDLFVGSEVETVRFENCTIELDDDSINDYVGCASEVFAYHMTKLTIKNCDSAFIKTIMGMFDGVDGFENLEIEILD